MTTSFPGIFTCSLERKSPGNEVGQMTKCSDSPVDTYTLIYWNSWKIAEERDKDFPYVCKKQRVDLMNCLS